MTTSPNMPGYKLPVNPEKNQGKLSQGFVTPKQDRIPQVHCVPARRVLPIIFIPGIMGSNLRVSADRQARLELENNIAWRPDNSSVTIGQYNDKPHERQLRLDPDVTEVDSYDPKNNPTGDLNESSDRRNKNIIYGGGYRGWGQSDGPLLKPDPPGVKNRRTQNQKARERGWGEIFYGSYENILTICESKLNSAFTGGVMDLYLKKNIEGVSPLKWNAHPEPSMAALDEITMREAVKGCWFPVHAMGYNWLRGNAESGVVLAGRITDLINKYVSDGFECEKVILITHSMGGLVARGIVHPEIGKIADKVLGVVHGVMPAMGAGAAYKRMRCGVEGSYTGVASEITAGVLGDNAADVTAVLANSQGAMELLPSQFYGSHWLELKRDGAIVKSWPEKCPYEEIYKVRGKWFSLLREQWINPAGAKDGGFLRASKLLDEARKFHEKIDGTYHMQSYAHYGADINRKAWHKVVWEVGGGGELRDPESLKTISDNRKGSLQVMEPRFEKGDRLTSPYRLNMLDAAEPGDQTVPLHSADAQLRSGKFKGIFRQVGYEHQASYSDPVVLASTIYVLFKIISTMKWPKP
ncbi:esterase/lipase family protein [Massilia aurea]|uniref:esterase/lipase family protein n=1 Tax=Massilia aurea TaxID=373040 RepID=UPI001E4BA2A4|nr:GPI inositol-deacylase [Massilia aurea]